MDDLMKDDIITSLDGISQFVKIINSRLNSHSYENKSLDTSGHIHISSLSRDQIYCLGLIWFGSQVNEYKCGTKFVSPLLASRANKIAIMKSFSGKAVALKKVQEVMTELNEYGYVGHTMYGNSEWSEINEQIYSITDTYMYEVRGYFDVSHKRDLTALTRHQKTTLGYIYSMGSSELSKVNHVLKKKGHKGAHLSETLIQRGIINRYPYLGATDPVISIKQDYIIDVEVFLKKYICDPYQELEA